MALQDLLLAFKYFIFLPAPYKLKKPKIRMEFSRTNLEFLSLNLLPQKDGGNHIALCWLIVLYGIMATQETLITPVSDLF